MPPEQFPVRSLSQESPDEMVEVVDEFDQPVLVVPAMDARLQKLRRRVILVLLHDNCGRLYLQKRSKIKLTYPERWDVSASGHVKAGEAKEDAARRELAEELGVKASGMAMLAAYNTKPDSGNTQVTLFHATAPAARPAPDNNEVEEILLVEEDELGTLVRDFSENLTPALAWVFKHGYAFADAKAADKK